MSKAHEPAFPRPHSEDKFNEEQHFAQRGLTKREYFAGLALQGILASEDAVNAGKGGSLAHLRALCAIDHADALVAELEKKNKKND